MSGVYSWSLCVCLCVHTLLTFNFLYRPGWPGIVAILSLTINKVRGTLCALRGWLMLWVLFVSFPLVSGIYFIFVLGFDSKWCDPAGSDLLSLVFLLPLVSTKLTLILELVLSHYTLNISLIATFLCKPKSYKLWPISCSQSSMKNSLHHWASNLIVKISEGSVSRDKILQQVSGWPGLQGETLSQKTNQQKETSSQVPLFSLQDDSKDPHLKLWVHTSVPKN